jgi:hypothetical protein
VRGWNTLEKKQEDVMKSMNKLRSCFGAGARFGGIAAALTVACSGADLEQPAEDIGVHEEALQFTHRVRIQVVAVTPGFTSSMMTSALAHANPIWAAAGVQFDFNPATDVMNQPGLNCADGNALGAFGDAIVGKIAVFYCPNNWSGGGANVVSWAGGNALAHELGHYFHLGHVHRECWVPEDEDKPTPAPNDGCGGVWSSVESCIRAKLQNQALPAGCPNLPTGAAIRDFLLDGDGLADTPIGLHLDPGAGNPCAPGYSVPLVVNFSNGSTQNFAFTPTTTNMLGYFSCTPTVMSASQITIARDALLLGNRNHLINKNLVTWSSAFSDANGWTDVKYYSTIGFPDVNANGRADVCGRGSGGINCGLSTGTAFAAPTVWSSAFSDANGWGAVQYYSTVKYPNANGTGGADVCGRGTGGIVCATSTGTAFSTATTWNSSFSDANGWNAAPYYTTIGFPNVNGTGGADVCGRGIGGIVCATSSGSAFTGTATWSSAFSDANGWNAVQYYSTIKYPNVNSGTRADVCGRGISGIVCATSTGSAFGTATTWASQFSDANGWNQAQYYSTIAFPDLNGDGMADVCGRGVAGMVCGISNGSSFTNVQTWLTSFSDANGWNQAKHYRTISFPDLDNDGRADVCGRGTDGVYCAYSNGTGAFVDLRRYSNAPSDANGWTQPQYYSTLQFAKVDTDAQPELCGRGVSGILCEQ